MSEAYQICVSHIDQSIEANTASEIVARQLRVDEGFPLLMITRVVFRREDSRPVLYSQDLLRSDYARVSFSIQLEENG